VSVGEASTLRVLVSTEEGTAISPILFGAFFEELSHAGEGGLYAELVADPRFNFGGSSTSLSLCSALIHAPQHGVGRFPSCRADGVDTVSQPYVQAGTRAERSQAARTSLLVAPPRSCPERGTCWSERQTMVGTPPPGSPSARTSTSTLPSRRTAAAATRNSTKRAEGARCDYGWAASHAQWVWRTPGTGE
jgi:hypothetical protein